MNVFVIGAASTKFGELWGISPKSLARDAFVNALKDSNLDKENIEALFVGNMLAGITDGQAHLGALFADDLELTNIPALHIEGAGASGGLAVHMAVNSILSGQYQTVAVLGIEKMTDYNPEIISRAMMGAASDNERTAGATRAGLYAMVARAYGREYGASDIERTGVSVKNHFHGSLNANAHYRNIITADMVAKSPLVADPTRLLECAPVSDGASALVISGNNKPGGVEIIASEIATDSLGLAQRKSLTEFTATQIAARKAYGKSGIGPGDIDIAEIHDSFSIAEIIALEDLGFFAKGEAGRAISKGEVTLGSSKHLAVNTSGGLKAAGYPVGAAGINQIVEIVGQLRGRCGERQLIGARIGLAQSVGGSGATAVINILKNND